MLNEQETAAMCAMVSEFQKLAESRLPGHVAATWNLQRLASSTGDDWEHIVRTLLANRPAQETPADLVGALQDKVHTDAGPFRAGSTSRRGSDQ